jgi:hypothetical protein
MIGVSESIEIIDFTEDPPSEWRWTQGAAT